MNEIFLEDDKTGLWVSNLGRVLGLRGRILKGYIVPSGHIKISYGSNNQIFAHRLVARNFIPNPLNLPFINHKDENPANNRVDNLEWCTSQYNNTYGTARLRQIATKIKNGKTVHCVLEKDGNRYETDSCIDMSRITGVSPSCVYAIMKKKITHSHGFHLPGVKPSNHIELPCQQLTITNGKETLTFPSQGSTAKFLNVHSSKVCKMVRGSRYSIRGWHIVGRVPNRRPVFRGIIELTNGTEILRFMSVKQAADYLSINHSAISQLISGKKHHCKGWRLVK